MRLLPPVRLSHLAWLTRVREHSRLPVRSIGCRCMWCVRRVRLGRYFQKRFPSGDGWTTLQLGFVCVLPLCEVLGVTLLYWKTSEHASGSASCEGTRGYQGENRSVVRTEAHQVSWLFDGRRRGGRGFLERSLVRQTWVVRRSIKRKIEKSQVSMSRVEHLLKKKSDDTDLIEDHVPSRVTEVGHPPDGLLNIRPTMREEPKVI